MTLFSSVNTALSGLQATMAALQTTGHNISNAATPGFSRQRVELAAARPQTFGDFQIGRGVSILAIRRVVDQALEARLRDAASTLSDIGARAETLQRLEALVGALSDNDLGAMLDRLFASLHDFANNPQDISARVQVLGSADTVARTLNFLATRIQEYRVQLNTEIRVTVDEINRRAEEIAELNRQIVSSEKDGLGLGTANDLRDRRDLLLRELSDLVEINAVETSTGEMNVLVGSSFLVFGGEASPVGLRELTGPAGAQVDPVFANFSSVFNPPGGKLRGLLDARDEVLGEMARDLDVLAGAIAFEFNRVQSTGQGLKRFGDLTSLNAMADPGVALSIEGRVTAISTLDTLTDSSLAGLVPNPTGRTVQILTGGSVLETRRIVAFDAATGTIFLDRPLSRALAIDDRYQIKELPFPVVNGSFDVVVTNEVTGVQQSFTIDVDLDRVGADTTWSDIVADIDALAGLSASLTGDGRIRIQSGSNDVRFSFADDTSGFLAAAGLNAMFSGADAATIAVNSDLESRPEFLSGAQSANAGDNSNALAFTALRDLAAIDGTTTLEEFYQGIVGSLGVQAAQAQSRFENQALIAQQLENQRERISGVNIDEEAVHMIQFQRSFQASARFIGVIDELLDTLINGI